MSPSSLEAMWIKNLLGNFKNSKKPERPQAGQTKGPGPRLKVDPEHLEYGAKDDDTVELVEGGVEVVGAQGVHSDHHLKHEAAQEKQLSIN